ncbi:MAG: hypothetical protein IAE79_13415 [Anaerolinea sp.]|nr:hypothetical protein [Anaerolinea sp.]
MNDEEITQPDLFGVSQKREQSKQAVIKRNQADTAAGVKPLPKPLFDESTPADKTKAP